MSVSSADPDKLQQFVDNARSARESMADKRLSVASKQSTVSWSSPDYYADVPALANAITMLGNMADNERFVSTIRSELLRADAGWSGGIVSVGDAAVRAALDDAGVGSAPMPVAFEPTTLNGLPPTSGFVDDPICAANGNMIHQDVDVDAPGIAESLTIVRTYNSLRTDAPGAFGSGWTSALDVALRATADRVEVDLPDGATAAFVRTPDGGWGSFGRRLRSFERDGDGWIVHLDHRRRYGFDGIGRLAWWGVGTARVEVEWSGDRITRLAERVSGRTVEIEWGDSHVRRVVTGDGRTVTYEHDADGRLLRATGIGGHLDYEWRDGLLTAVIDADGVAAFRNEYDADGRVVRQVSPHGRDTSYRYEASGLTVITDERAVRQAMVHDARGNLVAIIDTDGSAMKLTYDHADRMVRSESKAGHVWEYRFNESTGELVERIDPDGLVAAWSWDPLGRLVARTDRSGAVTRYEYEGELRTPVRITDANGGVTAMTVDPRFDQPSSVTDADGVRIDVELDADGLVVGNRSALGEVTSLVYDAAGRLVSVTDAVGTVTALEYDEHGRVTRTGRADAVSTYTRTAAGRIAGGTEPGEVSWTAVFGPHGSPQAVIDAAGAELGLEYDSMGNVTAMVAPDGARYEQRYDDVGRRVAVVDPTGAETELGYDRDGHLVRLADAEGRVWRREVDAFGRTVASTLPDGSTTRYTYHPSGEIATVATPGGSIWATEVDAVGRVVAVVSPLGGRSEIVYSAAGRVLERRSPAGRVERYRYDAAGRVAAVTDVAGRVREFGRDERGRPVSIVDPSTGLGRSLTWDPHGRLTGVAHSEQNLTIERDAAGRVVATTDGTGARTEFGFDARGLLDRAVDAAGGETRFERDVRGRLVRQTLPSGGINTWSYDATGHHVATTDPTGVATRIVRDRTGLLTGLHRGDDGWDRRLDPAGREVERRALDGGTLATFRYDADGHLVEAMAPGGPGIEFLWDADGHVTEVTDDSGTTTIERDADGWAVAMIQPGGLRTRFERAADGRLLAVHDDQAGTFRPADGVASLVTPDTDLAGRLLLGPDGAAYRYDDAGRLAEIAPVDGQAVTFEYGADGLLAVERGGLVRRFRYDGGGRVIEITVDGVGSATYDYDAGGRRVRQVAPDGTVTRFEWTGLDRLAAISTTDATGASNRVEIEYDAFGRAARVNGLDIGYDPVSGSPSRIGQVRVVNVGEMAWRSDQQVWTMLDPSAPTGLQIGQLTIVGVRVHDAGTRQFLSPDPLAVVPASAGASSAHTYAWLDPINHLDPSGLRPISQDEWNAIRSREESGRLGLAWDAIKSDPWGSIVAGAVIVGGVALCFTPLAPIGVGVLVGAGISAGMGFATGNLNPRQVALSGVIGGITGVGGAVQMSLAKEVALNAGAGALSELGSQIIAGNGIDISDILVNGALSGATGGAGRYIGNNANSIRQAALMGAGTEGGASIVRQALTGDRTINAGEVLLDAAGGGINEGAGHYLDHRGQHSMQPTEPLMLEAPEPMLALPAPKPMLALPPGPSAEITVYRGTSFGSEIGIQSETGLMMSDAARDAYMGTGDVDIANAYSQSAHHHASQFWGSERDYVEAHGAFGSTELTQASGPRSMVSVTTDPSVAEFYAGKGGTVYVATVPADSLIPQTLSTSNESEYLAPHSIAMRPLAPAGDVSP